ncbi:hypothetical protein [Aquibium sp. ELW1220]|uniref:hypothetical protein n=1 Tax=Aquibium sp. ELW1220 TaxID=2976766 RepID=UPI0025B23EF7|nr:hypothetical protein [Aquibium sp. ELW1220]MDN2581921.1 hypothetical protein [Aquibium sp. ELW1220]
MRLPVQSPAIARRRSTAAFSDGITPSGCSVLKKIACAAAVAACATTCLAGPAACISCFGAVGASSCIDCL